MCQTVLAAVLACTVSAAPVKPGADGTNAVGFITPEELDKLPEGIRVTHEPKVAMATVTGKSQRRAKYTWWYKTTLAAIDADVTIVQFGAWGWQNGNWVAGSFTGRPFTSDDFAAWYQAPNAVLRRGQSYSDPTNWSSAEELVSGKTRWYFIGMDASGRRVKGEAIIGLRAEINPKRPKDPENVSRKAPR